MSKPETTSPAAWRPCGCCEAPAWCERGAACHRIERGLGIIAATPIRLWKHRRRGTAYSEFARAALQSSEPISEGTTLVIYQGVDGHIWARPAAEFEDGRFEELHDVG